MKTKILLSILLLLSMLCNGYAQNQSLAANLWYPEQNPYLVPANPEVASFIKYGHYPVSYSTGIPEVSFPVYTINTRELTVPITLSYLGGGIKVTDQASWVGLGWHLNAGGAINCSIQGLPDKRDMDLPTASEIRANNDYQSLMGLVDSSKGGLHGVDKMRDRYDYSFCGISGTFYLMDMYEIIQVPKTENKIERISSPEGSTTEGFILTDSKGNLYYFTVYELSTARSFVFNSNASASAASFEPYRYKSAWYLTKIESFNKTDVIEFIYDSDITGYTDYSFSHGSTVVHNQYTSNNLEITYQKNLNEKITECVPVLREIRFDNGKLVFNSVEDRRDNRNYRLSSIALVSSSGDTLRTTRFEHSYFAGDRLMLRKVSYEGSDGEVYDDYTFEYYDETLTIPALDSSTSTGLFPGYYNVLFSQDQFGYYNGAQNKSLLGHLSPNDNNYTDYIADRSHNAAKAKAHSLRKVQFITGGYTEFIYDDTDYSHPRTPAIRIKEIKTVDNTSGRNSILRKLYEYYDLSPIVGFASDQNIYSDYTCNLHFVTGTQVPIANEVLVNQVRSYSSEPLIHGYHLNYCARYGKVIENVVGNSEAFAGPTADTLRTVYEFTKVYPDYENTTYYLKLYAQTAGDAIRQDCINNMVYSNIQADPALPEDPIPYDGNIPGYFIDADWNNPELAKISLYEYKNHEFILKKEVINTYEAFNKDTRIPIGLYCKGISYSVNRSGWLANQLYYTCPSINNFYFFDICVSSGCKKLVLTETKEYDGDKVKTMTEEYRYDNIEDLQVPHPFVTYYEKKTGLNEKEFISYKYPADEGLLPTSLRAQMLSKNCISPVLEERRTRMSGETSSSSVMRTEYQSNNYGHIKESATYVKHNLSDPSGEVNQWDYKTEILAYDEKGNPTYVRDYTGNTTVYLWGYNRTYPIAVISNSSYSLVSDNIQKDDTSESGYSQSSLDNLRGELPDSFVSTYTYKPLVGKLTETSADGTTTGYRYDSAGRLAEVYVIIGNVPQAIENYEYHFKE